MVNNKKQVKITKSNLDNSKLTEQNRHIQQVEKISAKNLDQVKTLNDQLTNRTRLAFKILNLTLQDILVPSDKDIKSLTQSENPNIIKLYKKSYEKRIIENIKQIQKTYEKINVEGVDKNTMNKEIEKDKKLQMKKLNEKTKKKKNTKKDTQNKLIVKKKSKENLVKQMSKKN